MFAPMANPYDSKMSKDEKRKIWDRWSTKRKLMHILARRFPSLLRLFYHRSFLSGKQGQPESWLSVSLGKKVCCYRCFLQSSGANAISNLFWVYHYPLLSTNELDVGFVVGYLVPWTMVQE
jgi:hypothetical protein